MAKTSWGLRYWLMIIGFGGGAFIASVVWIFLWLAPSSDELLKIAAWRLKSADSYHVAVDLQYHGTADAAGRASQDFRLESEGDYARRAGTAATVQDFSLQLGADEAATRLTGRYARQDQFNLLTLHDVPARLGSLSLQPFRDKTLRVDLDSALARLPDLPFVGGPSLSAAAQQELAATAVSLPFLGITEKLKDEAVRGMMTHHYKVRPELIYVRDFLKLVEAKRLGRELTTKEQNYYDTLFAGLTAGSGELWLRSSDYFVQRLRLPLQQEGDGFRGTWTLTLNFSGLNESANLPAVDLKGIEDAAPYLDSLLAAYTSHLPMAKAGSARLAERGGGLPLTQAATPDQADVDDDGLSVLLERFYGTDVLNPDSDGDGMSDGDEVTAARSPLGPWGLFDFTQGRLN